MKKTKITLKELVNSNLAFSSLMSQPIDSLKAFRLKPLMRSFQQILEDYGSARNDLITKYGEVSDAGGAPELKPGSKNWVTFLTELDKILLEEKSLEIPLVTIDDCKKVELSPADMMLLDWLIKEK